VSQKLKEARGVSALKVIHIVEKLDRGAVEKWLVRMLRAGVTRGWALDWTFYCVLGEKGALDDEAASAGARVVYSSVPLTRKVAFMSALRRTLREHPYEVMHCHHDLVSAIYLASSAGLSIRKRIVHVHNADEALPTPNIVKAALSRPILRMVCLSMADTVVGISNHTLEKFLAGRRKRPKRDVVHYYGIDSALSIEASRIANRAAFRASMNLPENALILLFAGRMTPEKNPVMAVDILAALRRLEPRAHGIFVGTGSLQGAVQRRAKELDVATAIHLLGWRDDLSTIMAVSDWFVLPRPEDPMEGFGLVVVEAQLAGLRLLLSQGVPNDAILPTASFRKLSLSAGAGIWAQAAVALMNERTPSCDAAIADLRASPMDMDFALAELRELYA
jgi:glycosyltransferase involved in cell wall biosynthesis